MLNKIKHPKQSTFSKGCRNAEMIESLGEKVYQIADPGRIEYTSDPTTSQICQFPY